MISSHESPRDSALTYRIPGVEVDAPRPDMRPALARASVAVAPLWTSDNMRQTVLQPMGGGIPVVVTSQAAQALGAEAGRDSRSPTPRVSSPPRSSSCSVTRRRPRKWARAGNSSSRPNMPGACLPLRFTNSSRASREWVPSAGAEAPGRASRVAMKTRRVESLAGFEALSPAWATVVRESGQDLPLFEPRMVRVLLAGSGCRSAARDDPR